MWLKELVDEVVLTRLEDGEGYAREQEGGE